jgi:hypothetical protein
MNKEKNQQKFEISSISRISNQCLSILLAVNLQSRACCSDFQEERMWRIDAAEVVISSPAEVLGFGTHGQTVKAR